MNDIFDNEQFFESYAKMDRSKGGLQAAGEWHQLEKLFPDMTGAVVLDLGCGYGWHCKYAVEHGASSVLGIDLSEKMIAEAKLKNDDKKISYKVMGLNEYDYPPDKYDFVISNLVLHYVKDLDEVFDKVYRTLKPGGVFLFNIEHPVFTSGINEDWIYDEHGNPSSWPVDNYFYPGERTTKFLGHEVQKQHHTLTQILMGILNAGFTLQAVEEAQPAENTLMIPEMKDEMRRPMMLLVKASK